MTVHVEQFQPHSLCADVYLKSWGFRPDSGAASIWDLQKLEIIANGQAVLQSKLFVMANKVD